MYQLRHATIDDLPALTELIAKSVRGLSVGYYDDAQIDASLADVFGVDTQLIADRTYFLINAGDAEIAACGGWSDRKTLFGGDQMKREADSRLDPAREPARI